MSDLNDRWLRSEQAWRFALVLIVLAAGELCFWLASSAIPEWGVYFLLLEIAFAIAVIAWGVRGAWQSITNQHDTELQAIKLKAKIEAMANGPPAKPKSPPDTNFKE
jgi:hypothetical protein